MNARQAIAARFIVAVFAVLGTMSVSHAAAIPMALVAGLVGVAVSATATARSMLVAASHDRGSAAVWFGLVPASVGCAWFLASAAAVVTAPLWSLGCALGAQLVASSGWAAIALVASFASRAARDEETEQEVDRILREEAERDASRFSALEARYRLEATKVEQCISVDTGAAAPIQDWSRLTVGPRMQSPMACVGECSLPNV